MRAKFVVTSIERCKGTRPDPETGKWEPCELRTVKFYPVTDGSEENKRFWAATPSGAIELGVANLEAVEGLELGDEYFVDFSLAPRPTPAP